MLTASQTKRVEIPHEPGEWADIRMLSWKQRSEAEQNKASQVMKTVKDMGAETFQTLQSLSDSEVNKRRESMGNDPLSNYDAETVLRHGLLRLSYVEGAITPDVVDDLDGDTVNFVAGEIVKFSTRNSESEEGKGFETE